MELRVGRDPRGHSVQGSLCVGRSAPAVLRIATQLLLEALQKSGYLTSRGPITWSKGQSC